jgi:hypothetical protein
MINILSFLKLDTEKLAKTIKDKPSEIRKVKTENQAIIYNPGKDWLRVQNFNKNNIEISYFLHVSECKNELIIKKYNIPFKG